jgi:hypothetical protein
MTRRVTLAKLREAEADRWPGYAAWVVEEARAGGIVQADAVILPNDLYARIQAEVGRRRPGIPPRPLLTPAKVAHGVVGIAKALTGTGGTSVDLVAHRTAVCRSCPHAELAAGVLQRCSLCGCSTWAKIRNAREACPIGRWGPRA